MITGLSASGRLSEHYVGDPPSDPPFGDPLSGDSSSGDLPFTADPAFTPLLERITGTLAERHGSVPRTAEPGEP
ncbi:hypothetical protein [Planobispora rosea]|uniref:hypothetical protein n=1 Tax=Planobispora rosea TaxID=35762 RepID=UPI00114CB875|nr:hypothetical protein [Planobispora rosea]